MTNYKKLLRCMILFAVLLAGMFFGGGAAWGQITPTTDLNGNGTIEDNEKHLYLIQTQQFASFYISPKGTDELNTVNLPNATMLWYFLEAEYDADNDIQYYYIVNNSTGKYVYNTDYTLNTDKGRLIRLGNLVTNDDTKEYRFYLVQNGTTDYYYIYVKQNGRQWRCLNKQGGNTTHDNGIRLTNDQYVDNINSRWKFISYDGTLTWPNPTFTVSTDSEKHYYKIRNKKTSTYYISTNPSTSKVTYSSTASNDMAWYFKEASSDGFMKYYYIINPEAEDKYMYFVGNTGTGNQDNAVSIKDINEENTDPDRFLFVIVQAAVANGDTPVPGYYMIVPKLLIGNLWTSNSLGPRSQTNGSNMGIISGRGKDIYSHWSFETTDYPMSCSTPTITYSSATGNITITTITPSADIHYTTDGVTVPSSNEGTLYSAPFFVSSAVTIKAIATRSGYSPSEVATVSFSQVATPSIQKSGSNVISITTATGGATIYYTTDGSTPTTSSSEYTEEFVNDESGVTIKAIAMKDGMINSIIKEESFTFDCATPTISFNNSTSQVSISGQTGTTIYYTTDGSDPTASHYTGTGATSVTINNITSTTTIKAIATHAEYNPSTVAELTISKVATPTIQNNGSNAISITSETPGTTIYYTTDGSTPTTSSTRYTAPLTEGVSGKTIKAIAVKTNMINSNVATGSVTLQCATPVITRVGMTFTISCSMPTDATLYYSLDGTTPSIQYSTPVSFTSGQLPMTITAVARHANYTNSETASFKLLNGTGTPSDPFRIYSTADFENFVRDVNDGGASSYSLEADVSAERVETIKTFAATFDGNYHTITDLTNPLFGTVKDGVVKNVMLQKVVIKSEDDTVGAIANIAMGYSRIYNCGILPDSNTFPEGTHPLVTTTGTCAGGLVGSLRDDSRVVNCFSYADVSAEILAAGIVGKNTFPSSAAESGGSYAKLRTAIVNCMFYGDITGGKEQYSVYGGELINNADKTGINNYNYYRSGSTFTTESGEPTAYNCSFPAEERYLTQVEFHRSLLNSNRELCGWWVGSDVPPYKMDTREVQAIPKDASLMAKWVLDNSVAPYPILKPFGKYASIINNPGNQTGNTLTVTVQSGSQSTAADKTLYIPITNMDTLNHDYGYYKVQLPYFNSVFGNPNGADWEAKYAGNYTRYVVTGWKVTDVTTDGSVESYNKFKAAWEDGYNFADRRCIDKDLFDTSGRVFAQGGYYYVPDGVTGITIEAYWGKAIYVRNNEASYDRVNITKASTGSPFAPAGTRDNNVNDADIQETTKLSDALTEIDAKKTVYDYALVLVGNIQESVGKNDFKYAENDYRGFTIMSVDLDFDEEPDYCLEWQLGENMARQVISPIRFDFLPVVELGIAGKLNNSTNFFSLGCYRSQGHFEVTETAFIRFGQFEFELKTRDEGPIILNGGIYDQYCRGRNEETNQHINYVILGGHVVMPSFTPGAHVAANYKTRHCAVNALGGDFTSFYLTGGYNEAVVPYEDNPHCYIDGGHFGTIAAAYKEGIWGNVTWRINHALIGEFYGGGVMAKADGTNYKIVKGNIDVVIDNSTVGKYCGGPKFGDMVSGKTVTTRATNTVFTQYFGAGNGGTNYTQYANTDDSQHGPLPASEWTSTVSGNYHVGKYRSADHSYEADYDIEVINTSTGDLDKRVINRSYYYAAQFATTNTGNVTNTLTNCTIKTNFYGAGFLGGVTGNVTSTLTDTRVMGSAFGAGYSASAGTVSISNIDKVPPVANIYTGMIKPQSGGTSTTYYWTNEKTFGSTTLTTSSPAIIDPNHDGKNYFYTEIPLDTLGAVSSDAKLTIKGNSKIGTMVDDGEGNQILKAGTGNVYGGGDQSAVSGNTKVILEGGATIHGNVYGGGNNGSVGGRAAVIIQDTETEP